ncbi:MAG TPA: alanine racemase, partial [Pirellulales bacterium]|nr:alanine racemase [Pirellulales bacterium]
MEQLSTPALVIDFATVDRNLRRLADYAEQHDFDVRPHAKTHKSKRFGAAQIALGAIGLTVAKVGEAEVLASVADDLLVAYTTVGRDPAARLANLARHSTVRVAIDSLEAAEVLSAAARRVSATIGLMVEVDVGLSRTGVQTPAASLKLAQLIDRTAGVRLDGICCYPGHIWQPPAQQQPALLAVSDRLAEVVDLWAEHGLEARIVSGGSTPTAYQSHLIDDLTEIRPGTYLFNDMNLVRGGFCTLDDCAARLVCTVISTAVPGQFVLDAGSKALSSDRCVPAPDSGHGHICEYPEARIARLSEEHAQVDARDCQSQPKIGEQVTVIPNHICPAIHLQDSVWIRET